MNCNDFYALTPFEFEKIYNSWYGHQELMMRERWEQTRFLAMCVLTPYTKKRLKPTDIAKFTWDTKKKPKNNTEVEKSTVERFEAMKKITGN
jgi:hypothetical protein